MPARDEGKRPHLFLVTPVRGDASDDSLTPNRRPEVQLSLFPGELGPVVIYVRPTDRNVHKIIDSLRDQVVHAILDLRETPFLTFRDLSRHEFLEAVSESSAAYINVHKYVRSLHVDSVSEFLRALRDAEHPETTTVAGQLKDLVTNGPIFVFSDSEPEKDLLVQSLESGLQSVQLEFSASFFCE